jgi:hypothetical protein
MTYYKIILIIIIFIILYSLYFYYPKYIQINQTTISNFNFSLLYEKLPIIILDTTPNIDNIISKWFKHNFISQINNFQNNNLWLKNNSKYKIIHTTQNQEIHISNPYTLFINNIPISDSKIISLKLKENQFFILPYKWNFFIENNVNIYNINDIITIFFNL